MAAGSGLGTRLSCGWRRCRYVCIYVTVRSTVNTLLSAATRLHGTKMADAREPFEFFLRSASSEHYIERKESSNPNLPIVIDIRCEMVKRSDYCSCPVYSLQCQTSQ